MIVGKDHARLVFQQIAPGPAELIELAQVVEHRLLHRCPDDPEPAITFVDLVAGEEQQVGVLDRDVAHHGRKRASVAVVAGEHADLHREAAGGIGGEGARPFGVATLPWVAHAVVHRAGRHVDLEQGGSREGVDRSTAGVPPLAVPLEIQLHLLGVRLTHRCHLHGAFHDVVLAGELRPQDRAKGLDRCLADALSAGAPVLEADPKRRTLGIRLARRGCHDAKVSRKVRGLRRHAHAGRLPVSGGGEGQFALGVGQIEVGPPAAGEAAFGDGLRADREAAIGPDDGIDPPPRPDRDVSRILHHPLHADRDACLELGALRRFATGGNPHLHADPEALFRCQRAMTEKMKQTILRRGGHDRAVHGFPVVDRVRPVFRTDPGPRSLPVGLEVGGGRGRCDKKCRNDDE